MENNTILFDRLDELPRVARELMNLAGDKKILAFHGQMGVGKTTLIKAICAELGVLEQVSSPTFSIVNEYNTVSGNKLFHFDFYRIKSESEAYDLGYEEYFYSGNLCLVEWPEKIESLLPENALQVMLSIKNNQRVLLVNR